MTGIRPSLIAASRRRGSFDPLTLFPALWLDASDASTLYDATTGGSLVAADGAVARWEDKSGNGRHATQGTSGDRPRRKINVTNSRDGILFDNTDKLSVSLDINIGSTIFLACNRSTGGGSTFGNLQNASPFDGLIVATGFDDVAAVRIRNSGVGQSSDLLTTGTNFFITSVLVGSSSSTGWINGGGESVASASYVNRASFCSVGSPRTGSLNGESFTGNLLEILIFPTALSTADRQRVESYLSQKYNIALA